MSSQRLPVFRLKDCRFLDSKIAGFCVCLKIGGFVSSLDFSAADFLFKLVAYFSRKSENVFTLAIGKGIAVGY